MNKVLKVCGGIKKVLKCKSLRIKARRRLYEGIVVPAALSGPETWCVEAAEKKRLNVGELRCLRKCVE